MYRKKISVVCWNTFNRILNKKYNQPFPPLNIKYVSTKELEKITKTLEIKNSYGYDEVSTIVMSSSIHYISSPLTYIINRMLSSGVFPSRLNYAEVTPLFKTGEKIIYVTIDPFPFSHPFQRFLRRLFIIG